MRRSTRRAFSMIEVLIALALLVVVAMISVPMFASRMDEARAEGATSQVQVALSQARSEAQETGLPIRVFSVVNENGKTNLHAEAVQRDAGNDQTGPGGPGLIASAGTLGRGSGRGSGRVGVSSRDGMASGFGENAGGAGRGSGWQSEGNAWDRGGALGGGAFGEGNDGVSRDAFGNTMLNPGTKPGRSIVLPTGFTIEGESDEQAFDAAPRSMGGMMAPSWASTKPAASEPRTLVIFLPDGTAISAGPIKVRNRAGLGGELLVNPLTGVAVLADARSAAGTRTGNAAAGGDEAELIDPFR